MSSPQHSSAADAPRPARPARRLPSGLTSTDAPAPGITIDLPTDHGQVLRHGAQVISWAPAGEDDVLWLSPQARFDAGASIRGGVPICFPWFGPGFVDGHDAGRSPAHGVARTSDWRLSETGAPDGIAHLLFTLTGSEIADSPAPDALPGGAKAWLSVGMHERLRLDLTVQAGTEPFTFETALHTYLAVGDARQARVTGLDGCSYFDKAGGGSRQVQQGDITFGDEVDRVYDHGGTATLVDPVLGRSIRVSTHDSASTIVWNPGEAKTRDMSDVPDADWTRFVCVESGNVREHAITLQPGESHTMSVIYTVKRQG